MKKILIITTRSPFPPYGGDKIRIFEIIKYLSKYNSVDIFFCDYNYVKTDKKIKNKSFFFKLNLFERIINTFYSLITFKPMQTGYFFSGKMKRKIEKDCNKYDTIIFHLTRSCNYMPNNFSGKVILEMTDVVSQNYNMTYNSINFFNPIKYLYKIESSLLKKYEIKMIKKFNHTVLVSKKRTISIAKKI